VPSRLVPGCWLQPHYFPGAGAFHAIVAPWPNDVPDGRRDFIAGIGGAVAMPLRTSAQQPAIPTIGYLTFFTTTGEVAAGFREALNQAGYIEGRNVRIEVPSADRNRRDCMNLPPIWFATEWPSCDRPMP
jgi:hypothetical protein